MKYRHPFLYDIDDQYDLFVDWSINSLDCIKESFKVLEKYLSLTLVVVTNDHGQLFDKQGIEMLLLELLDQFCDLIYEEELLFSESFLMDYIRWESFML